MVQKEVSFFDNKNPGLQLIMSIVYKSFLTTTNQIFLCTILNQLLALKGGWSSSLEASIIEEEIALVVDQSGAIDWKFMEHFVEKLKQQEWSRITKVLNFSTPNY